MKNETAGSLASDWWWDEEFFISTLRGRVRWESAAFTSRSDHVRLMRLDNVKLRAFRTYVRSDTPMRLVRK